MTRSTAILTLAAVLFGSAIGGAALPVKAETLAQQGSEGEKIGNKIQSGVASWYGPGFHGRRTANGEKFNTNDLTAAHRTLPFGTRVKVVNERTGHSVVVRINDRGPYAHGRVIDLSRASAQAIGVSGVAKVALVEIEP